MNNKLTTITIFKKDKKKFKNLVNKYNSNQQIFFGIMINIMRGYKPEITQLNKSGG